MKKANLFSLIQKSIKSNESLFRIKKKLIVSIGENCLTDNILSRYYLKSFSTPFSSGRSNIEYILHFEKENYEDLLAQRFLRYEEYKGKTVPRNKKYVSTCNRYHSACMNGFEFTHHDVVSDAKMVDTIRRRYKRLLELRDKSIVFVYHHRICSDTDKELMLLHLEELSKIYQNRNNTVHVFAFTQSLISNSLERRVEYEEYNSVRLYTFFTLNEWEGSNPDIFWARCDDDLIKRMIEDIESC